LPRLIAARLTYINDPPFRAGMMRRTTKQGDEQCRQI
jgi:hypothetical protein